MKNITASVPLVSILIPAYNHELYIEECLNSVIDDPYPAKEIVIINDGSSDQTHDKIIEWVSAHEGEVSVVYLSRENKGICATLNELVDRSKGEFLKLGASDDYFIRGGIQAQVSYFTENQDKYAVIGDFTVVGSGGEKLYDSGMLDMHKVKKENYATDFLIKKEVISNFAVSGATPMLKRSLFQRVGGWNEALKIDDWDFFLRLVARNQLGFVDAKICAYRIHGNNTCKIQNRSRRIQNWREKESVARQNLRLFEGYFCKLLKAQIYLARAKIKFVQHNPFGMIANMTAYWWLSYTAKFEKTTQISLADSK